MGVTHLAHGRKKYWQVPSPLAGEGWDGGNKLLNLPLLRRGKVRDVYDLGDKLLLVSSDRLSAFDYVLPALIPGKGETLTKISSFWFEKTKHIADNHMLATEISEISEKELRGYSLIKDIYNQPALLLGINFSRDIYQQGSKAVGYFLIISAAGGLTVLAIVGLLLGVLVLGRIFNFNAKIAEIAQSKNFSKRIVVNGGDEISSMAANVNSMLESLERASSETEAEHQKAQSYLKVMASMFVALDSSGNVSFANQSAKEILGVATDEEIIGKNWLDNFVPQKIRPEVKKVFNDTIAGEKKSDYYENLVLTKKGEERLIAWHNTILKDGGGNVIGTVSSGNDITQYREQSEKEKEQSEDLKKANELMMGREMRIIELKKEVEELKQRLEQNGRKT